VVTVTEASDHGPRDPLALGEPPNDLTGFPSGQAQRGPWFRAHPERPGRDSGCWWFTSHERGVTPGGRFDLLVPNGTCYLADSAEAAVRERVGRYSAARTWVPANAVDGVLVSSVATLPTGSWPLADSTHASAAALGATRELSAATRYGLTSRWAQALFREGFAGLLYQPRFSTGTEVEVAVFGAEGTRTWAVRSSEAMRAIVIGMGLTIAPVPHSVDTDNTATSNSL
jgi:hypothetical protein